MSFCTYKYSKQLENIMKNSDMLFVVSSGNFGKNIDSSLCIYPACFNYDNIITVSDIRCDGQLSYMPNYGKKSVDIAAPGTDIVSAISNNEYTYLSGTSFSTALVAGVAALVNTCSSQVLSSEQIKTIITNSSTQSSLLQDKVSCNGYVNVIDAINASQK